MDLLALDAAWVAGIFGLVGVVLGSAATLFGTYVFEVRREERELRAALFVTRSELNEARGAIADAFAGGIWPPGWDKRGWAESWTKYAPILGASKDMSDRDLTTLAAAYLEMAHLQSGLVGGGGTAPLSASDREFLERARVALDAAASIHAFQRVGSA